MGQVTREILTMGGIMIMTELKLPDGDITEHDLCDLLGMPRQALKEKRAEFTADVDWTKERKGVVWTAEAARRLVTSFAPPEPPAPPQAEPAPEKKARRAVLTVANPSLPNDTLIAAVEPGEDPRDRCRWKLVRIRPGLARRFTAAMQILAQEVPGLRAWRFLGPPDAPEGAPVRYPRFRGRWGVPGEKAAGSNTPSLP